MQRIVCALPCCHACSVWHDTAIPFSQVLEEFDGWLLEHDLLDTKSVSSQPSDGPTEAELAAEVSESPSVEAMDNAWESLSEGSDESRQREESINQWEGDGKESDEEGPRKGTEGPKKGLQLWEGAVGYGLRSAIFVTCGNWDVKTKVVEQCRDSNIPLPRYFLQWTNIKDIYLNFYKRQVGQGSYALHECIR